MQCFGKAFGCVLFLLASASTASANICRVTTAGTAANNGSTWALSTTLQDALANGNGKSCTEIWVKSGAYKPTANTADPTIPFAIDRPLRLYGGFAGTETVLTDRTPATMVANPTVLSADIDNNDTNHATTNIDATQGDIQGNNSYNVVTIGGPGASGNAIYGANPADPTYTLIDGFTITGGNAIAGGVFPGGTGGGLHCNGTGSGRCNPAIVNVTFSGNRALSGGAMYNYGVPPGDSSPTLTNVTFTGNFANYGGAMYNNASWGNGPLFPGNSNPILSNVTFIGNTAQYGGAMYNDGSSGAASSQSTSSPILDHVTFSGNSATSFQQESMGGAMYNNGKGGTSSPTLSNVTFNSNNTGMYGGGMFNDARQGISNPTLSNVTFNLNSAANGGGAMYNEATSGGSSSPTLTNVTFFGNSTGNGGQGTGYGSAVYNYSRNGGTSHAKFSFVTATGNFAVVCGGMLYNDGTIAGATIDHSILWGDSSPQNPSSSEICNVGDTVVSNSVLQGDCPPGSSCIAVDPNLGVLQDNGGYTQTMLPGPGGAAIDTAIDCKDANGNTVATDQRGVVRPETAGGTCDIGAVEASPVEATAKPVIATVFGAATIEMNSTTSLTFTLSNPNLQKSLTGIAFTDSLPAGLPVATPNGLTTTCGGTATAVAGTSSASLSGATLAAGASCTVAVVVRAATSGVKNNSVQVSSANGGIGNTSNASLTVSPPLPPTITKAFGATTVLPNITTSLTFTLGNPNAFATLTGVAFMDNMPAGLVLATPTGLTSNCGGTATAVAGASSASLSGATLAVGATCTMTVGVKGATIGVKNNSVQVTANEGTGNTSNATLTIAYLPPAITNSFGVPTISVNGTTSLTYTISNPNPVASLTGVAFTDSLPEGLVVATPNGLTNTCGGTATAVAGDSLASLSGGTVTGGGSCTMSVGVQGTAPGVRVSSVQVTSDNGGTGNTSNATLTVASCRHSDTIYCGGFEAATIYTLGSVFSSPVAVALDASGNLFVAEYTNDMKQVLAPDYMTANTIGSGFKNPYGVAVDASGNVFVADHGNSAVKKILAPGYTTVNTLGSGFIGPNGVAVDASGNVFVADYDGNTVKEILAPGYTTINTLGSGFDGPADVAVDASGNVFVTDFNNNTVKEILAPGYTTAKTIASGFHGPQGIAIDASGNVFVADTYNSAVKEILAPGYTTILTLGSGFFSPVDVAVDAHGNVFVADTNNDQVKVILAPGWPPFN